MPRVIKKISLLRAQPLVDTAEAAAMAGEADRSSSSSGFFAAVLDNFLSGIPGKDMDRLRRGPSNKTVDKGKQPISLPSLFFRRENKEGVLDYVLGRWKEDEEDPPDPAAFWRGKDAAASVRYRESGNAVFEAGRVSEAALLYSVSVLHAPMHPRGGRSSSSTPTGGRKKEDERGQSEAASKE